MAEGRLDEIAMGDASIPGLYGRTLHRRHDRTHGLTLNRGERASRSSRRGPHVVLKIMGDALPSPGGETPRDPLSPTSSTIGRSRLSSCGTSAGWKSTPGVAIGSGC